MKRLPPEHERGMALLTVLLMVAVMSVLAAASLDDIRFGLRRTGNAAAAGQAQWYAIGAEELARSRIQRLVGLNGGRVTAAGGWNGQTLSFPIQGGLIRARVQDGGNCFDLNSVVQGASGAWTGSPAGVRQFQTLLRATGVPSGEAAGLTQSLVDWIDSDTLDDGPYLGGRQPYRSGGELMAEVSELRAVRGVTPELYARLRPYVCALPRGPDTLARLSPINVNTIRPEQAVLLTVLTDGVLSPAEARAWIERRPPTGWTDPGAFLSHPLLVKTPVGTSYLQVMNGMLGYPTRFFTLDAVVEYDAAEVAMSSLFEQDRATGRIRLAARRWTVDE